MAVASIRDQSPCTSAVEVVVQGDACCSLFTGRRSLCVDTVVHIVLNSSQEQEGQDQLNLKMLEPKLPAAHPTCVPTAMGTQ